MRSHHTEQPRQEQRQLRPIGDDDEEVRTPLMVRERSLLRVTPPPFQILHPSSGTSAVLTWGLEGDAPLGGWNADGKEAVPCYS